MILQVSIFIIAELLPYDVNAQILHNQTLEEKVREIGEVKDNNPQISVGDKPNIIKIIDEDKIYVGNIGSDTVSVINGTTNTKIKDIPVGSSPASIEFNRGTNTVYVANFYSDTVSVISPENDTIIKDIPVRSGPVDIEYNSEYDSFGNLKSLIFVANIEGTVSVIDGTTNTKIKDIPVRPNLWDIEVFKEDILGKLHIYVANLDSDTVSVISPENDTYSLISPETNTYITKDIPVGSNPNDIECIDKFKNDVVYVANSDSDTVSVINGTTNTKIKDIPVGSSPASIEFNRGTNTVYVANSDSDGVSVIDGVTGKVVAGVKLNINPPNTGYIKCNDLDFPLNQFLYISSECKAKPNKGFEFISWVENLENNSNRTVKTSAENNYILESFYDIFNYKPDDPAASLFQFGNFTANFKALPPPISSEYLIPLYGIIITTIVGWSIPSIINWIRTKRDIKKLSHYHKEIILIYNDGKLDEKDLEYLNKLKKSMSDDYSKGKLNERHYESLEKEISISYEEIFMKRINSIINDTSTNKEDKKKQLIKINEDIEDAYSKSRINELHYTLLKEKIESLKTMADSSNNKFLKKSPL